ncbi:hypothetical protein LENED_011270 [Lentinula edodes]|uniref:Uncharacterized protein n=1 Tax=Lentinula edodes TaxID=5353 RepID=A0A1Q3EPK9_LENED|nr:hypothetical protein LENED_011270 [Lentinula edodes]
MSSSSSNAVTGAPNPALPPVSSPPHPDPAERVVDAAIDELASTLEEPPLGQLALFKSVFGVGVSLARYIVDDPLWPLLAAAGLPCSFCVRGKKEANCSVVPHLARCSNCDDKKPCVLAFARRFLEVHGDPGQRTRFALPSEQWRDIATKVEASTNSTVALMELNALDEQDQRELDRLELGEFRRQQPQLPRPLTTSSLPSPIPSAVAIHFLPSCRLHAHWRKREKAPGSEVSPEVHDRKRKRSAGESRDAEVPDYRRVVLVLRPPLVDTPGSAPLSGGRAEEDVHSSPPLGKTGSTRVPPSLSQDRSSGLPVRRRANSPGLKMIYEPSSRPPQASETSRAETSTLTLPPSGPYNFLDDHRNKDLEASRRALQDVAADRLEYSRVLAQFRAIEAELPEAPLEDALTWFHLAVAEVDSYREVAIRQKQEISELREQDRLEDLEETVHCYRTRAHVAEELIRKYPEDEGLYEVDLPSLSSLQDKLTASEVMLRRMATFAHRLHSADPANLLHHHNMYVGGLIEAIITLLSRSLLHPPEQMRTVVKLALEYLSQGRLTHSKLYLRSTSSLLYYYSNAADRVDGLYQDMFTHSRFSTDAGS